MLIEYKNKTVENFLTDYKLMNKKIGKEVTKILIRRINALKAANNVGIFLSTGLGKPHFLSEDLYGHIAISLTGNYRLIIKPKTDDISAEALKICSIVCVKGVEDYHGSKNNWIVS
ncbi:MAG: hypothetical protein ACI4TH_09900 [Candidatus Ornithomonoglobus sp.]